MKIKIAKFKSGERYPFLLSEDGVPDFWVTHFVTQRLRMDMAATTISTYLKNFHHFKKWEIANNRNILDEIYKGKIPCREDIDNIKEHCLYQAKALSVKAGRKVIDMAKFMILSDQEKLTVSKSSYITRVAHIAEFLSFIGRERVKHKPNAAMLFNELDKMKKLFKRNMPKSKVKIRKPDKSEIESSVFYEFIEVSKPNSPINPFKGADVKFRNFLILQVLIETGFRRSELLSLQISNIGSNANEPALTVVREHDRENDPRTDEPNAKTLGRTVPISKELRDLLYFYINNIRTKTKIADKYPYIFVSHKDKKGSYKSGKPLEKQTINDILNRIKSVNPERFWGITPHLYRHFFNELLSIQIDNERQEVQKEVERLERSGLHEAAKAYRSENEITEQRELEIRADFNGHSSLDSGRTYLKRTIKKKLQKISKEVQKKLSKAAVEVANEFK